MTEPFTDSVVNMLVNYAQVKSGFVRLVCVLLVRYLELLVHLCVQATYGVTTGKAVLGGS